jgi:RHS repeat-associated protein
MKSIAAIFGATFALLLGAPAQTAEATPTVSITSPASGAIVPAGGTLNLAATASATVPGASITEVKYFDGLTPLGVATAAPYSIAVSNLAPGAYLIHAKATDSGGRTATSDLIYVVVDGADSCLPTTPLAHLPPEMKSRPERMPLRFAMNKGQLHEDVKFHVAGQGYQIFLTPSERVISLGTDPARQTTVRMRYVKGEARPEVSGVSKAAQVNHYLAGRDASRWRTHVPSYNKVRYDGIYPGVDEIYYGRDGQIEFDLHVKPGIRPADIKLAFSGHQRLHIDDQGDLNIATAHGTLTQKRPIAYQDIDGQRHPVEARYIIASTADDQEFVGFMVGDYDTTKMLVIDPVLVYSTYIGGANGSSGAESIALSRCGEAFIGGWTYANNYPITPGAYDSQPPLANYEMGVISKLNQDGSDLVWSTFIGGAEQSATNTKIKAIAVDSTGHVYFTGITTATDFPITPNSIGAPFALDGPFVGKLNTDGNAAMYLTFNAGGPEAIAVDGDGNAYLGNSQWINKLNAQGTALHYTVSLRGLNNPDGEEIKGIALSRGIGGEVFVAMNTKNTGAEITDGVFRSTRPNSQSSHYFGYVAKLRPADGHILVGTYIGTQSDFRLGAITLDGSDNILLSGTGRTANIPGFQNTNINTFTRNNDLSLNQLAWVLSLNSSGSVLNWASRFGGSVCGCTGVDCIETCSVATTAGAAIALDALDNVWVAGTTGSNQINLVKSLASPFPAKGSGWYPIPYVAKLSASGSAMQFFTLLGGQQPTSSSIGPPDSMVTGIKVDADGAAYVTGWTNRADQLTTDGAYQETATTGVNTFVTKINEIKDTQTVLATSATIISANQSVTLTATVTRSYAISGSPPTGTVKFRNGGTELGTASLSGGQAVFNTGPLTAGNYSFTAHYYQGDANPSDSTPPLDVSVVTSTPPTVSLSIPGGPFTPPANITLNATAIKGTLDLSRVEFFQDGQLLNTDNSAPYSYIWTNVPAGTYSVHAKVTDIQGLSATSQPITVTVSSVPLPTVAITSPNGGSFSAPVSIPITATAAGVNGSTVTKVEFKVGARPIGTDFTAPYEALWSAVAPGSYVLTAQVTDSLNVTVTSAPVNVTISANGVGESITFLHSDLAGNTIAATDASGALLWKESYTPFGERVQLQPTAAGHSQWFAGKQADSETGLSYFGARYYDPVVGRFMSIDPVTFKERNLHSFNRYAYGNNNAYKYVDPDGRYAVHAGRLVFSIAYAAATRFGARALGSAIGVGLCELTCGWVMSEGKGSEPEEKPSLVEPDRAEHILEGDATGGGHRAGTGKPGKSEFPSDWSDERILGEISDVATDPGSTRTPGTGKKEVVRGTRGGVDIEVVVHPDRGIITGYPTNRPRNPKAP